jgi:hypothetical protein
VKAGTLSDASIDPAQAAFVQIVPEKQLFTLLPPARAAARMDGYF